VRKAARTISVSVQLPVHVAFVSGVRNLRQFVIEFFKDLVGHPERGLVAGDLLERGARRIGLAEFFVGDLPDPRTAMRLCLHKARRLGLPHTHHQRCPSNFTR
jgi:hypothetical protein